MVVFICGESPEEIWCAIYDAWMSRLGHKNVRIEPQNCDPELFCEYREVISDPEKAGKVISAIKEKLSETIYEEVYKGALSQERYRADKLYRYLILAFHYGKSVSQMMAQAPVFDLYSMNRNLGFELDHMKGFIRFAQTREGVLLSKIGPKNDLTVLLAVHFADRLSGENWILYDEKRKKAAVHQAQVGWVLMQADTPEWQDKLNESTDEMEYQQLWKAFHTHIAIMERKNPHCQMNMLPLRFRPYMVEFQQKES